jgi:hypothetical protein
MREGANNRSLTAGSVRTEPHPTKKPVNFCKYANRGHKGLSPPGHIEGGYLFGGGVAKSTVKRKGKHRENSRAPSDRRPGAPNEKNLKRELRLMAGNSGGPKTTVRWI